jgi:hypothetical protein
MREPWAAGKKIIVLEPRQLAARAAAARDAWPQCPTSRRGGTDARLFESRLRVYFLILNRFCAENSLRHVQFFLFEARQ